MQCAPTLASTTARDQVRGDTEHYPHIQSAPRTVCSRTHLPRTRPYHTTHAACSTCPAYHSLHAAYLATSKYYMKSLSCVSFFACCLHGNICMMPAVPVQNITFCMLHTVQHLHAAVSSLHAKYMTVYAYCSHCHVNNFLQAASAYCMYSPTCISSIPASL